MIPSSFRALVVDRETNGETSVRVKRISSTELPKSNVKVRVCYSSVNYKDGLASISNGRVVKSYPLVPGIDLAGVVEESEDSRFKIGDRVIATGFELGVSWFGGFSEYASVPSEWLVPLPLNLSLREAMIFGTAGFTAGLCLQKLEVNGLRKNDGPVIVTGASGGVGSISTCLLASSGHNVVASTGRASNRDYLMKLGAAEVIDRVCDSVEGKALGKERWAGAIDSVGGKTLEYLLQTTKYGGSIASCGLTGGSSFQTTVFPFIIRGVNLLGIDSANCPAGTRQELWNKFADDWRIPPHLMQLICTEISLDEVPEELERILQGKVRGRTSVRLSHE